MCDPVSAAILMGVGTAVSAYGSYEQGQTQKKVADYNAKMQRQAADDALQRGSIASAEHQDKVRKMIGRQTAIGGASNLDLSGGSFQQVQDQTQQYGQLDSLRLMSNAQREAWGMNASADITEWQGNRAQTAGYIGAGASLLSGASNSYFGYKSATR